MKIVLCGFGNPDNRGVEAIARTVSQMLKLNFNDGKIIALTGDYGRVPMISIDSINSIAYSFYPHKQFITYIYAGMEKLFHRGDWVVNFANCNTYKKTKDAKLCIAVGGDTYCYTSKLRYLTAVHEHYHDEGAILVHWGSSFEENIVRDPNIIKDLNRFALIMVRESISYETLKKIPDIKSKIVCLPDPAFTLGSEMPQNVHVLPNTVGINISSLIYSFSAKATVLTKAFQNLFEYILNKTDFNILLIPHVTDRRTGAGDYDVMKSLINMISNDRCTLVPYDLTAMNYKAIISKCRFFMGARTHATIAAYSTNIPTICLGYSVKSRGIAKDIFGTYENYVLPVQNIKSDQDIVKAFEWLTDNEMEIKEHLTQVMPAYKSKAAYAGELVKKVAENGRKST